MKRLKNYILEESDVNDIKFIIFETPEKETKTLKNNNAYTKIEYKYVTADISVSFLLGFNKTWKLWCGEIGATTYDDKPYSDLCTNDYNEALSKSKPIINEIIKNIQEDRDANIKFYNK